MQELLTINDKGRIAMDGLKDVQGQPDYRRIAIDKVGVKDISYPIVVLDRTNKIQHTIATVNMYVDLPHHFKGTHMSRFVEILNEYKKEITVDSFREILRTMKKRFDAKTAHLEVEFPYFIEKAAPVSMAKGIMDYKCKFSGSLGEKKDFILEIHVPISTLCPCSKEVSKHGAHNQRGMVHVAVKFKGFIWIEDIVETVESSASCPVYSLLKRPDEKYVTEHAYDNPKFVEDVVRDIAIKLEETENILWFSIGAENWESIHNHSAYAYLERRVRDRWP